MSSQPGLNWIQGTFDLEPHWASEPNVTVIESEITIALHQAGRPIVSINASLPASPLLHNEYAIRVNAQPEPSFVARIVLPVDPSHKTLSEVATLRWLKQHTDVPVPTVHAFAATSDNAIGFEWLLLDHLPGQPLSEQWHHILFQAKETLVRQIATLTASLFHHRFDAIGSLTLGPSGVEVSRLVAPSHFIGQRISIPNINRGPYKCSLDWLNATLDITEADARLNLEGDRVFGVEEDEYQEAYRDIARRTLRLAARLRAHLLAVFTEQEEETVLMPHLDDDSIPVDASGQITGLVDQDLVCVLPLWASSYPAFLHGPHRTEQPDKGHYDAMARQESRESYWEILAEWEKTRLRSTFMEEMLRLAPEWTEVHEKGGLKRDFVVAVEDCASEVSQGHVRRWLDEWEREGERARVLEDWMRTKMYWRGYDGGCVLL